MKRLACLVFYSIVIFPGILGAQGGPTESSGQFQELMLAVNGKENTVTGYYQNATGWDSESEQPRFNCIFYLSGKKKGDGYSIQTWFPGDREAKGLIAGELKFLTRAPGIKMPSVWIRLNQEHGGCWNVNSDLAKPEGDEISMGGPASWIEVRVVSAERAHFFQNPGSAPTKAYVVRGDGLGVLEKKPGWVRVDYQGKARGWVRETDLFSSDPPR